MEAYIIIFLTGVFCGVMLMFIGFIGQKTITMAHERIEKRYECTVNEYVQAVEEYKQAVEEYKQACKEDENAI